MRSLGPAGGDVLRARGGASVEVDNLTWRPAGRRVPVFSGLDLKIEPGQKVLLAGPSGSGKSTLLRAIAGLLLTADVGDLSGSVRIDGRAPQDRPGRVGLLLQDPSAAIVSDRVGRDVAFGPENTQVPRPDIAPLVRRALEAANFPYGELRRTNTLSGGETQRLALAGALAMNPQVLLLDEPTAMLDLANSERVRRSVLDVCDQMGTTLVVVEHRLGPWVADMDRCVVLDANGEVCADGSAEEVLSDRAESLAAQGIWVPGMSAPEPLVVDLSLVTPVESLPDREPLMKVRDVEVRYRSPFVGQHRAPGSIAVSAVSCDLRVGRSLVLRGPSGAGKSTLLAVLAGLQEPDSGTADIHRDFAGRKGTAAWGLTSRELAKRLAWVPQLPEHGLVKNTVLDELLVTSDALDRPRQETEERARALLDVLGLGTLTKASAHHLSGGEQRRLVVAAALLHGPCGALLDEPTVGQDRLTWSAVAGLCHGAVAAGTAIAVSTHDQVAIDSLGAPAVGDVLTLQHGQVIKGSA